MADPVDNPVAPSPAPAPAPAQSFSAEYVKELREEAKGWRLKHEAAIREADEHKTAAQRASEEANAKIAQATTAAEQRIVRAELKAAALKAGMVDLDGLKLADLSSVKLAEDGSVEGADALMASLKEAKPYLFGATNSSSTPGAKPAPKPAEPKSAKDMDADEYRKAKAAMGLR
jgi:cell wall-associated NlpC family hydrolase